MKNDFGVRLKKLRTDSGLTQSEVAGRLSRSTSAVRMWELGVNEPDINTLVSLSILFDCSLDYLLCRDLVLGSEGAVRTNVPVFKLSEYFFGAKTDIYSALSRKYIDDSYSYFYIDNDSDDMNPVLTFSSLVLVRRQDSCMNGQIAFVKLGGKYMFRKIIFCNGAILLQPAAFSAQAEYIDSSFSPFEFEIEGIAVENTSLI